jgi:hypothetical protein
LQLCAYLLHAFSSKFHQQPSGHIERVSLSYVPIFNTYLGYYITSLGGYNLGK